MVSLEGKLIFKCVESDHVGLVEVVAGDFDFETHGLSLIVEWVQKVDSKQR